MKIQEVMKCLDVSQDRIKLYEKEELINPVMDEVGIAEYHYKELERLRLIIYLDSIGLTINEIRKILVGTKTLGQCIKEKNIFEYETLLTILKEYYAINIRKKAYYAYENYNKELYNENQLVFGKERINIVWLYQEEDTLYEIDSIEYNDIEKIQILPVSRTSSTKKGKQSVHPSFINTFQWSMPCGSLRLQFFVDLNIKTVNGMLLFESVNWDNVIEIIDLCKYKGIRISDPIHIYEIFKQNQTNVGKMKYFESHYRRWAREYHLENFRRVDYSSNHLVLENWVKERLLVHS
ncbi:MAG: MerR family transcriptional regulator [Coprobacillaceae bacterium]